MATPSAVMPDGRPRRVVDVASRSGNPSSGGSSIVAASGSILQVNTISM
jgi:hypothetical protein